MAKKTYTIIDPVSRLVFETTESKQNKNGDWYFEAKGHDNVRLAIPDNDNFIKIDKSEIVKGGALYGYLEKGNNVEYINAVINLNYENHDIKDINFRDIYKKDYADNTTLGVKFEAINGDLKKLDNAINKTYNGNIDLPSAVRMRSDGINAIFNKYDIGKDVDVYLKCTTNENLSYEDALREVEFDRAIAKGVSERIGKELKINTLEERAEIFRKARTSHSGIGKGIFMGLVSVSLFLSGSFMTPIILGPAAIVSFFTGLKGYLEKADKQYLKELQNEIKNELKELKALEKQEKNAKSEYLKTLESETESKDNKENLKNIEHKEAEPEKKSDKAEANNKEIKPEANNDKKMEAGDKEKIDKYNKIIEASENKIKECESKLEKATSNKDKKKLESIIKERESLIEKIKSQKEKIEDKYKDTEKKPENNNEKQADDNKKEVKAENPQKDLADKSEKPDINSEKKDDLKENQKAEKKDNADNVENTSKNDNKETLEPNKKDDEKDSSLKEDNKNEVDNKKDDSSELIKDLSADLDKVKAELDNLKDELDNTKAELDNTKSELDSTKSELDNAKSENQNLADENKELAFKIENLENDNADLKGELKDKSDSLAELEASNSKVEPKSEDKIGLNESMVKKLQDVSSDNISYDSENSSDNKISFSIAKDPADIENGETNKIEMYSSKDNSWIDSIKNENIDVSFNKHIRLNAKDDFAEGVSPLDNLGKMILDKNTDAKPLEIKEISYYGKDGFEHKIEGVDELETFTKEGFGELKELLSDLIGAEATKELIGDYKEDLDKAEKESEKEDDKKDDTETSNNDVDKDGKSEAEEVADDSMEALDDTDDNFNELEPSVDNGLDDTFDDEGIDSDNNDDIQ